MDGFREIENVVVIAATNREQMLDDALIRSGRFDTKIKIKLPCLEDRHGIIDIHLKNVILFFNSPYYMMRYFEITHFCLK